MVGWLDELLFSDRQLVVEAATLSLLTHRHPSPPPSKATPEQLDGFKTFLDWKRRLSREMLGHASWIAALKAVASINAEREERAAQHASLMKWTQWIHEGPADGQRRQHRFTRTVKGWTATAKSTGMLHGVEQEDEWDDLEGVDVDELNQLRMEQDLAGTPATAQQEADDEAEAWGKHWGVGTQMEPLQWPDDMGEGLPELIVEELLEASGTFPTETGLGWDQWHPRVTERLAYSTMLLLVAIILECERTGEWPTGVALVLIALLPKPDGGYRPIGLLLSRRGSGCVPGEGRPGNGKNAMRESGCMLGKARGRMWLLGSKLSSPNWLLP